MLYIIGKKKKLKGGCMDDACMMHGWKYLMDGST